MEVYYASGQFMADDRSRAHAAEQHADYTNVLEAKGWAVKPSDSIYGGLTVSTGE